jgi:hypothetical protein
MAPLPDSCQHIKVNGLQCGSPAMRRNKFCYFHKRHHQEHRELNAVKARRRMDLPRMGVKLPAPSIAPRAGFAAENFAKMGHTSL